MDPYYWKDKFSHRINRLERSWNKEQNNRSSSCVFTKQWWARKKIKKHNTEFEHQVILLIITHDEKRHYLAVKSLSQTMGMTTIVWTVSTHSEQKANLNHISKCGRIMIFVTLKCQWRAIKYLSLVRITNPWRIFVIYRDGECWL